MNIEEKNGLYLDLDVLYDTRLATLELINKDLAKYSLANGYLQREEDVFKFVDKETFRKVYDGRDIAVLEKAAMTRVPEIIKNFMQDSIKKVTTSPFSSAINVFLNVYPYRIDKETARNMLEPLSNLTGGFANVHVLRFSPEQLTLQFCKDNLALMLMYDYEDWLEIHTKNDAFRKCMIPDITLFVPELYFNKKPSEEELRSIVKEGNHPFRALEKLAAPLIGLSLIQIEYFCALFPDGFLQEIESKYKE